MEVKNGKYKEEFAERWKEMEEEEKRLGMVFSLCNKLKQSSKEERSKIVEQIISILEQDTLFNRYKLDKEWCTRVIAMDVIRESYRTESGIQTKEFEMDKKHEIMAYAVMNNQNIS